MHISDSTICLDQTIAEGPGLVSTKLGEAASFSIIAKDQQGNQLLQGGDVFAVASKCDLKVTLVDNKNGSYSGTYIVPNLATSDMLQLHITCHGYPIKSSPFSVRLEPMPLQNQINELKNQINELNNQIQLRDDKYDSWVLEMSSQYSYSAPSNTREALLDSENTIGVCCNKVPNSWISATYSQPMIVNMVEIGCLNGWGSLNNVQFQFLNPGSVWETLFTITGLDSGTKIFDIRQVSSTAFRLIQPNLVWFGVAVFKLRP